MTRTIFRFFGACAMLLMALPMSAQQINPADSTGLPGDNFSLQAAIELFKKATSPEEFEQLLNAEDNDVNNLDLNEDGQTDYIRVIDHMDGDVHAIVLQAIVSENESQDVAVIEIEKDGAESAVLQIVGDEDIYGEQVLVEPFEETRSKSSKGGPSADYDGAARIVVNVWLWPGVRYIYRPAYVAWVSPWRWSYYPAYWKPWRPRPWRTFYVRTRPFHRHHHVVTTHRVVRAHGVYAPRKTSSKVVRTRTTTVVAARGKNGKVVAGKRSTTSTTVKGKNGGSITREKTTTKAGRKGRAGAVGGKKTTTRTTKRRGGG